MNRCKFPLVFSGIAFLMQGCMLSGKMTRIVSEHYAPKASLRQVDNNEQLTVFTDSLQHVNGYCSSRYKSFFTVPLLVYTYSEEKMECRVNPKIYVNGIINEFNRQMQQPDNADKLKGKKIELHINHVPATFNQRYNDHFVFLQLVFNGFSFSVTNNEISNKAGFLRATYVIKDAATSGVLKKGNLSEGIPGAYYRKNYTQRRLYFVKDFITTFDNNLENSGRHLVFNLINEL